jgi:predicted dehydrogenase
VTLEREGRSEHVEVAGSDVPFVRQIEDFISTILDGAPSVVSLDESRRTIAATAALYQSARAGEAR